MPTIRGFSAFVIHLQEKWAKLPTKIFSLCDSIFFGVLFFLDIVHNTVEYKTLSLY